MSKLNSILLVLLLILFAVFYSFLSYYNRPAADDYLTIYNVHQFGVTTTIKTLYNQWAIRPSALLISLLLFKSIPETSVLFIYNIAALIILITAIYFILIQLLQSPQLLQTSQLLQSSQVLKFPPQSNLITQNSKQEVLVYASLFSITFYFGTLSIPETWFWFCASISYLLPLIFYLVSIAILLYPSSNLIQQFILLISYLVIAGSSESFLLFVIFCNKILIVTTYFRGPILLSKAKSKQLLLVTVLTLTAFIAFYYLSPGVQIRKSILHQATLPQTFFIASRTAIYLMVYKLPAKLPVLLLFALPFSAIGLKLSRFPHFLKFFSQKTALRVALFLLLGNYIALLPASYIMADRGPDRSLTINSFLITCLFIYFGMYLGAQLAAKNRLQLGKHLVTFSLCAAISFLSIQLVIQFKQAPAYAHAVDQRTAFVIQENQSGRTTALTLDPLPPASYFFSAELSTDTLNFSNRFFQKRFGLHYACRPK